MKFPLDHYIQRGVKDISGMSLIFWGDLEQDIAVFPWLKLCTGRNRHVGKYIILFKQVFIEYPQVAILMLASMEKIKMRHYPIKV